MNQKETKALFSPYQWLDTGCFTGRDCFHPTHKLVLLKRNNVNLNDASSGEESFSVYDPHGIEHPVTYQGMEKIDGEDWLVLAVDIEEWKVIHNDQPGWEGFGY